MTDFTKPLPEWNKTEVKPAQAKLDSGWEAQEKPPASVFNWFQNTTFEALQELQGNAVHINQIGVDVEAKIHVDTTAPTDTGIFWVNTSKTPYTLNTYNGSAWVEVGATPPVKSVNSKTGDVSLTYSDVGAASENHSHPNATETVSGFMSSSDKTKMDGIETGAQKNVVTSVASRTGDVVLTKTDVGLGNVDNVKQAAQVDFDNHTKDHAAHVSYGTATGLANAYAVTLSPSPTAYTDGMALSVKINVNATAASTINVNALGVKPIKKANGTDATNLKANGVYTLRYNSSTGNFILQGEGGEGTAQPEDVLSGETFTNDTDVETGTMPNNGAVAITPGTANKPIPLGYHNGNGYVVGDADLISANIRAGANIYNIPGKSSVVETSDATATAAYILSGKTAYVNGAKVTGTIPSDGAKTVTPGTVNQTAISAGHYASGTITVAGDNKLIPSNIKKDVTVFDVTGTAQTALSANQIIPNTYVKWRNDKIATYALASGVSRPDHLRIDNDDNCYYFSAKTIYKEKNGSLIASLDTSPYISGTSLGDIYVDDQKSLLYVVGYTASGIIPKLEVFDLNLVHQASYDIGAGAGTTLLCVTGDDPNYIYVSGGDKILRKISKADYTLVSTITLTQTPYKIAFAPNDFTTCYLGAVTGYVLKVDLTTNTQTKSYQNGSGYLTTYSLVVSSKYVYVALNSSSGSTFSVLDKNLVYKTGASEGQLYAIGGNDIQVVTASINGYTYSFLQTSVDTGNNTVTNWEYVSRSNTGLDSIIAKNGKLFVGCGTPGIEVYNFGMESLVDYELS